MNIFRFILYFIFSLSISPALADSLEHEHHDDEEDLFEEHTSHVHGHAIAQISYVQGVLNITKTLSSIDVFGFEHAPKDEEQNNKITQSIKTMQNANQLFIFKNNACALESVHIENQITESGTDSHQDHDSHEDEHHHHDKEAHDKDTSEESHTDVIAHYSFKCDQEKLETIEYLIFDHFPSLEEIEVEYISDNHQVLFTATHNNRTQMLH